MNLRGLTSQNGKPLVLLGLLTFMAILLSFRLSGQQKAASDHPVSAEARSIHDSAIVIDTHSDTSSETVNGFDIATKDSKHMEDIGKLRSGGMGAQFFAAYVGEKFVKTSQSAHRALEMIDTIRFDIVAKHPDTFELAKAAEDIERIHKQGKIAALIGIEGGHALEDSLRLLRDFYDLGVRYMTLTHVNTNNWADSSGDIDKPDVTHHNGLTDFGREVIHEMNRLGMMVDISHVSDKTFYDVLATTKAPVIASHSSCRAIANIPRNMTDDMIKALAQNGGVIQINFGCEFLSQRSADEGMKRWQAMDAIQEKYKDDPEKLKEEQKRLMEDYRKNVPPATLDDVVANIDHVKKLVGIDYVGLGSDFDGVTCTPVGLEDASKLPNVTQALLDKGYTAEEIRKVLGGNTLRLMRAVEKVREAGSTKAEVFTPGRDGVSGPRCIENCTLLPRYTEAARKQKIEGTVLLQFIVRADGTPDQIEVIRAVGYGLDESAIETVKKWRFVPSSKDGRPVDVAAKAEVVFRLK